MNKNNLIVYTFILLVILSSSITGTVSSSAQELQVGDTFLLDVKHSTNDLLINNSIVLSKGENFPNIDIYTVKIDSINEKSLSGMTTGVVMYNLTAKTTNTSYSIYSSTFTLVNYLLYAILPITDFWTMYETLTLNEQDKYPFLIRDGYPFFIDSTSMYSIADDNNFKDFTSISSEGLIFNLSHTQSTNFSVYRTLERSIFFDIPSNKSFVSKFTFFYNETLFFQEGTKSRIFYLQFSLDKTSSGTKSIPGFTFMAITMSVIVVWRKKSINK